MVSARYSRLCLPCSSRQRMKRINYYKKPALYQEAGVRECWIVDPAREIIVFFDFPNETPPTIYRFTDSVKVSIYKDFSIDFSQLNL